MSRYSITLGFVVKSVYWRAGVTCITYYIEQKQCQREESNMEFDAPTRARFQHIICPHVITTASITDITKIA